MSLSGIGAGFGVATRAVARALPGLLRDLSAIAGAALVAYGAWRIYEPAGFITGGVLLIAACLLAAMGSKARA